MITKDEAVALCVKNNGNVTEAAKEAGMPRTTFRKIMKGGAAKATPSPIGKTLAQFRETFDKNVIVPKRIKAGLEKLGDSWEYEVAFAKSAGVSLTDLANFREMFPDNWHALKRDGRRVWSSKSTIKAIRSML